MTEHQALTTAIRLTRKIADARADIPTRRAAVEALVGHGWSYQRIADALGISKSAVQSILRPKGSQ
jgi:DNA-directed RNA polymerase specialized sigma24 family protein